MSDNALSVSEAIEARRSIKKFDAKHKMTEAEVNELLTSALLSPSAFNLQHWRLVKVSDPALRKQIRAAAKDQAQVTDASLLLAITMDKDSWAKEPVRFWSHAPKEIQDYIVGAIDDYYRGNEQTQRDECMRSCGLIAMTLMLKAKEMGYDTCPMDGFDFPAVEKLIKLPEDHVLGMMLAVGKRSEDPWPKGGQLTLDEVVLEDHF